MRLNQYFDRIGYQGPAVPTVDVLGGLMRSHALHVPFENLDVQLSRSLTMDPGDAFEKIVARQRGGWCYEQNGLFGWALSEIGFDVTRVSAAVMRAERGSIADSNHLTLLVRTASDDQWLVDVGFGGSMIEPIPLCEAEYSQAPFRLGLRQLSATTWQFWEDAGDGEFSFDFAVTPADEAALNRKCRYLQTSSDSGFVQSLVAQRRRPDSHTTLRGKVFSRVAPAATEKRVLESPEELVATLRTEFGLDVPEIAELWPRIQRRHAELFPEESLS